MVRRKKIFGWSFLLIFLTCILTWIGYLLTVDFMNQLTASLFSPPAETATVTGWIKQKGLIAAGWIFHLVSKIFAFYLAFLVAYTLTTPGYAFLSAAAEKLHAGKHFDPDAEFNLPGVLRDIFEGVKIAAFGVVVTLAALFVNFIPGIGQALVFILYTYYSALMFVDYPASRRRWSLAKKLKWLRTHSSPAFRLGVLPALVSMIPFVNVFAMALLFPVLTVHTTLNFSEIELAKKIDQIP